MSPGPDAKAQWSRDKFRAHEEAAEPRCAGTKACVCEQGDDGRALLTLVFTPTLTSTHTHTHSPPRQLPRDYEPPMPTWKSKAGGVYIPIRR